MLEHPESFKLGGTNQTVTVMFADVRGFTRLSEHAPPESFPPGPYLRLAS